MLYIHILNDYKCTIIVIVLASSTYSVACITICCAILYILTKVSTVHVIIEFKGPLLLGWHHKNGEKKVKDPFGSYKTNQNSSHVAMWLCKQHVIVYMIMYMVTNTIRYAIYNNISYYSLLILKIICTYTCIYIYIYIYL